MKRVDRRSVLIWSLLVVSCSAITPLAGGAMMVVDEVLFQGDPGNAAVLSGTVDMTVVGSTLTVVLTNTTNAVAVDGAGATNLLTGVGFTLPVGYSIVGGTASIEAGSQVNSWSVITTDVSNEWGYANVVNSGHFDGTPSFFTYATVVGTVTSDVDFQFAAGSNGNPPGLGGPDFGLLSDLVPTSAAGGQTSAQSPITVMLTLNQAVANGGEAAFISTIDSQPLGIAFGSPDKTSVPEPSSAAILAGSLAIAFSACRRKMSSFAR
ncbi:MAG: hypothetical protein R3E01_04450 [Pirellulaceae bacterium]|nr:hypothetical protein [Planctomycetales bacterium]